MKTIIAFAVAAAFAAPALSQDKPKPPPAWHQGKPRRAGGIQARAARRQDDRDAGERDPDRAS